MPNVLLYAYAFLWFMGVAIWNRTEALQNSASWMDNDCSMMNCQNEGVCEHTTSKNGAVPSGVICKCAKLYFGKRCQHRISIKHTKITAYSVQFNVKSSHGDIDNSNNGAVFSLVHWSNYTDGISCSFAQDIRLGSNVISNLQAGTFYTICVFSGVVQWCSFLKQGQKVPDNCMQVTTNVFLEYSLPNHVIPVSVASAAIMVIVVIVLLVLRCKQKLCFSEYKKISQRDSSYKKRKLNKPKTDEFQFKNETNISLDARDNSSDFLLTSQSSPAEELLRSSMFDQDENMATFSRLSTPSQSLLNSNRNYTSTFFAQNENKSKLSPVLEGEYRSKSDSNLVDNKDIAQLKFLSPDEDSDFPPPPSPGDIKILTSDLNDESNA